MCSFFPWYVSIFKSFKQKWEEVKSVQAKFATAAAAAAAGRTAKLDLAGRRA